VAKIEDKTRKPGLKKRQVTGPPVQQAPTKKDLRSTKTTNVRKGN